MKFIHLFACTILLSAITSKAVCQQMFQSPFKEPVQTKAPANGVNDKVKKAVVVLTYDDALNVHLDYAVPLLDSLGLKATFYLSGYSGAISSRLQDWRAASKKGHELGNHTLFHPCTGGKPGREFVKKDYDLSTYSVGRIEDEIRMTNTLLAAIDGKQKRTFAYPCSDTKIGDTYYLKNMEGEFTAARAVRTEMPQLTEAQLYNLGSFMVNGQSGDELVALVKTAMQKSAMLVFLFHGVGGEHSLNVSLPAHRQLLQFLKAHQDEIWVAPMTEVAEHIKVLQTANSKK